MERRAIHSTTPCNMWTRKLPGNHAQCSLLLSSKLINCQMYVEINDVLCWNYAINSLKMGWSSILILIFSIFLVLARAR